MTIKEWRIAMQKLLLDIELIEDLPRSRIDLLPSPVRIAIENLGRDFIRMREDERL